MTLATIGTYSLVTCLVLLIVTVVLAAFYHILEYQNTAHTVAMRRLKMLQEWEHADRYASVYACELQRLRDIEKKGQRLPEMLKLVHRTVNALLVLALITGALGLLPALAL